MEEPDDLTVKELLEEYFRVEDLQQVLKSFELPFSGRKNELFERILSLINHRVYEREFISKVKKKIEAIYRKRVTPELQRIMAPVNKSTKWPVKKTSKSQHKNKEFDDKKRKNINDNKVFNNKKRRYEDDEDYINAEKDEEDSSQSDATNDFDSDFDAKKRKQKESRRRKCTQVASQRIKRMITSDDDDDSDVHSSDESDRSSTRLCNTKSRAKSAKKRSLIDSKSKSRKAKKTKIKHKNAKNANKSKRKSEESEFTSSDSEESDTQSDELKIRYKSDKLKNNKIFSDTDVSDSDDSEIIPIRRSGPIRINLSTSTETLIDEEEEETQHKKQNETQLQNDSTDDEIEIIEIIYKNNPSYNSSTSQSSNPPSIVSSKAPSVPLSNVSSNPPSNVSSNPPLDSPLNLSSSPLSNRSSNSTSNLTLSDFITATNVLEEPMDEMLGLMEDDPPAASQNPIPSENCIENPSLTENATTSQPQNFTSIIPALPSVTINSLVNSLTIPTSTILRDPRLNRNNINKIEEINAGKPSETAEKCTDNAGINKQEGKSAADSNDGNKAPEYAQLPQDCSDSCQPPKMIFIKIPPVDQNNKTNNQQTINLPNHPPTVSISVMNPINTLDIIKKRMRDLDSDIVTIDQNFKLSLICPITNKRICTPGRSCHCKHLDCFDVHTFFNLNKSKFDKDWRCPKCKQPAAIADIIIDGLIKHILISTNDSCKSVIFDSNALWKPESNEQENVDSGKGNQEINVEKVTEVIELDDDDDDYDKMENLLSTKMKEDDSKKLAAKTTKKTTSASSQQSITCSKSNNDPKQKTPSAKQLPRPNINIVRKTPSISSTNNQVSSNNNGRGNGGNVNESSNVTKDIDFNAEFIKRDVDKNGKLTQITCLLCNVSAKNEISLVPHLKGRRHIRNCADKNRRAPAPQPTPHVAPHAAPAPTQSKQYLPPANTVNLRSDRLQMFLNDRHYSQLPQRNISLPPPPPLTRPNNPSSTPITAHTRISKLPSSLQKSNPEFLPTPPSHPAATTELRPTQPPLHSISAQPPSLQPAMRTITLHTPSTEPQTGSTQSAQTVQFRTTQLPSNLQSGTTQPPLSANNGAAQLPSGAQPGAVQVPSGTHPGTAQLPPRAHSGETPLPLRAHSGAAQLPPRAHSGAAITHSTLQAGSSTQLPSRTQITSLPPLTSQSSKEQTPNDFQTQINKDMERARQLAASLKTSLISTTQVRSTQQTTTTQVRSSSSSTTPPSYSSITPQTTRLPPASTLTHPSTQTQPPKTSSYPLHYNSYQTSSSSLSSSSSSPPSYYTSMPQSQSFQQMGYSSNNLMPTPPTPAHQPNSSRSQTYYSMQRPSDVYYSNFPQASSYQAPHYQQAPQPYSHSNYGNFQNPQAFSECQYDPSFRPLKTYNDLQQFQSNDNFNNYRNY